MLQPGGIALYACHCERSEAIHSFFVRHDGLLRRFAPRNDGERQPLNGGLSHVPSPAPALSVYFIGQTASAMAACGGKIVTNLPPIYCSSTGSASLFWPVSSNLTRFQGMMVCSPGMSVAASASRIFSPSVDLARLMASARMIRPMN